MALTTASTADSKIVCAEQHLGGGDEVRRVATRLRAAMNIADLWLNS